MRPSRLALILGSLQFFVAIGAFPAGILMLIDPDGSALGLPEALLTGSPFDSYLIPGIILIIVNGVFQTMGGVVSFKKRSMAGRLGMALGLLLICWILAQMVLISEVDLLHFVYLGIGILQFRIGYLLARYTAGLQTRSS